MSDKKYISPEHAIRNIMELKSVGHNVQKERQSVTMVEEEQIDEASLKTLANTAYNIGRNVGDITTYGGLDYLGATRDYLVKNIGSLAGITKPTTFAQELAHEKEKTKKAEEALPDTIKTGVKTVKAGQEGFMAGAGKQEVKAGLDYLGKKVTGDDKEKWGGIEKELGKLGSEYAHELEKGQKAYEYAPKTYTGMEVGGTASALVGLPLAAARGTLGAVRMGAKYGPRMVGAQGKNILSKTAETLRSVDKTLPTAAGVSATAGHALTADETGQSEVRKATNKAMEKSLEPIVNTVAPLVTKGIEKLSDYEKKKKQIKEGAAEDLFKGVFKGVVKSADDIVKDFKAGKTTLKDIDAQLKYMSPGPERAEIQKIRSALEKEQAAKPAPKPQKAPPQTEPGREGAPVKPANDPGVTPIKEPKWPAPYKPSTDPFVPLPPANVPSKVPQRTYPDAVPEPANKPPKRVKEPAPVKTPAPSIPDKGRPAPTVNPVETKPKAPPAEKPKTTPAREEPAYKPKPAARPEVPGALPAAKPFPAARPEPVKPGAYPAEKPVPVVKPAPAQRIRPDQDVVAVPKTETAKKLEKKSAPEKAPSKKAGEKPPRKRLPFGLPGFTPGQSAVVGGSANAFGVQHYRHMADPRRAGFDEESRYDIEAVPRPKNKDKKNRTRQAEIIRKVIEEQKAKKKKETTVVVNPKLNDPDPGSN